MILSVSRRTDIPAFYADWFYERLQAGYARVANPRNPGQIRTVDLTPPAVDGIVFWTRNPRPMLDHLADLREYPYYFQITLNAHGPEVEPRVPSAAAAVEVFRQLSSMIGPDRVLWRYDPIFLTARYDIRYHLEHFASLATQLAGHTQQCTISFVDPYRKILRAMRELGLRPPEPDEICEIAAGLAQIGQACNIKLQTCAEPVDLSRYGIGHACCIDAARFTPAGGRPPAAGKDKNQRPACGCAASVDLGTYDTCRYGCVYCYAITPHARPEQQTL
jgi:hypothetical protein